MICWFLRKRERILFLFCTCVGKYVREVNNHIDLVANKNGGGGWRQVGESYVERKVMDLNCWELWMVWIYWVILLLMRTHYQSPDLIGFLVVLLVCLITSCLFIGWFESTSLLDLLDFHFVLCFVFWLVGLDLEREGREWVVWLWSPSTL